MHSVSRLARDFGQVTASSNEFTLNSGTVESLLTWALIHDGELLQFARTSGARSKLADLAVILIDFYEVPCMSARRLAAESSAAFGRLTFALHLCFPRLTGSLGSRDLCSFPMGPSYGPLSGP